MSAQPIRWELWTLSEEADRRFRRICAGTAAPLLSLALLFTLYRLELPLTPPVPPPQEQRYVELLQPKAAPQPRNPAPRREPRRAQPQPAQAQAKQQSAPAAQSSAREVAEHSGLMQLRDQLAWMSSRRLSSMDGQKVVSTVVAGADSASGRGAEGLAAGAAATSGGIGRAGGGSVTGQGGTGLGDRRTGGVHSGLGGGSGAGGGGGGDGDGRGARRSLAEIQEVFDRNKSPFVALYNRAARTTPGMEAGRVIVSLVIAPDGSVTRCAIVSSSFSDPDLEQKILARVRMLNFGAKNVPPFSYPDYPISFLAS